MSTQTSDNNKRIAKNTLLLYFCLLFMMTVWLFTCRSCRECFRDYEIDNYERLYKELQKVYTKEAFANMIKTDIRQRLPEPYASIYCKQFDDFKNVADFFEFAAKLMKRQ